MNRRAFLSAAPAALAAGPAAALCILDPDDTPVMRLFREWEAKFNWIESESDELSDAEIIPHCRQNDEQARRLVGLRCETPRDFAAKLIAATLNGNHDLSDLQAGRDLLAEARALVGGVA